MIKELRCPECKHMNEEPEEQHEQDYTYFCECENCNKTFAYSFSYMKVFEEFIAPCQNVDENGKFYDHDWHKIKCSPIEYFKGKYRCSYCDETKIFTEEEIKKLNLNQ